ncbi:MAG: hypothetical protein ONB05_00170 [candidate division KSB1 bacterium]|nr:hypothetical protein [candidate division KSB1 bacterium]
MDLLIVSNLLELSQKQRKLFSKKDCNIEIIKWNDLGLPRYLIDYDVAVLDFTFGEDRQLGNIQSVYKSLRSGIENFLNDGKIVIALCGSLESKPLYGDDKDTDGEEVYSYQILRNLFEDTIETTSTGTNFNIVPGTSNSIKKYFENVDQYWAIFHIQKENNKTIKNIRELALTKTGNRIISAELTIANGLVILLPGYRKKSEKKVIPVIIDIAMDYDNKMIKKLFSYENKPDWVFEYQTEAHKSIDEQIESLKLNKDKFEKIVFLLYGQDDPLVDSVKLTLEELGLEVSKTTPGFTIDLIAKKGLDIQFAIEVTGTKDKIKKDSNKINQIYSYFPNKQENEKIILLVNTYIHEDLKDRAKKRELYKRSFRITE